MTNNLIYSLGPVLILRYSIHIRVRLITRTVERSLFASTWKNIIIFNAEITVDCVLSLGNDKMRFAFDRSCIPGPSVFVG